MMTIKREAIDNGLVHNCFYGMSAVYPPKNGLGSEFDKPTVEKYGEIVKVNCITYQTLLDKHNIQDVDIIKIDAEGHDYKIFKQIPDSAFETCDFWKLEIQHLEEFETKEMVDRFKANGYNVYTYHDKYPVYTDNWAAYAEHKCHDLVAIKPEILL